MVGYGVGARTGDFVGTSDGPVAAFAEGDFVGIVIPRDDGSPCPDPPPAPGPIVGEDAAGIAECPFMDPAVGVPLEGCVVGFPGAAPDPTGIFDGSADPIVGMDGVVCPPDPDLAVGAVIGEEVTGIVGPEPGDDDVPFGVRTEGIGCPPTLPDPEPAVGVETTGITGCPGIEPEEGMALGVACPSPEPVPDPTVGTEITGVIEFPEPVVGGAELIGSGLVVGIEVLVGPPIPEPDPVVGIGTTGIDGDEGTDPFAGGVDGFSDGLEGVLCPPCPCTG